MFSEGRLNEESFDFINDFSRDSLRTPDLTRWLGAAFIAQGRYFEEVAASRATSLAGLMRK
jgi:hypothetical protein